MRQVPNYGDGRQTLSCAFCGGGTETRDHVPPRVFLDEPYPENLAVVPACQRGNEGTSLDEEYLACLLGCAMVGSTDPAEMSRDRIGDILERKPALRARLEAARGIAEGRTVFAVEVERAMRVALKLARGHALFELSEPQHAEPAHMVVTPLISMSPDAREEFETQPAHGLWPGVGGRAMQRMVVSNTETAIPWIAVQPDRYRYLCSAAEGVLVRIVLGEYLACEVAWA